MSRAPAVPLAPDLERVLAIDVDHHDVAVQGPQRAVDDGEIAVEHARLRHRVAGDADDEARRTVPDQQLAQVDLALGMIVGGRGKTGSYRSAMSGSRTGDATMIENCMECLVFKLSLQ
jgi:hypothetical protein